MNNAKKIFAALLAAAMLFLLAACNNDAENVLDISTINIGIITNGDNEESAFSRMHFDAFRTAYESAGAGKNQITTEENVSTADVKDMEYAMTDLVERGCRLVVGTDPGYYTELEKYASDEDNQNIYFAAIADYAQTEPQEANMIAVVINKYEATYLEGIAAGAASESGKIGYVADTSFETLDKADVNAFLLGAKSVNAGAQVTLVTADSAKAGIDKALAAGCDVLYARNYVANEETGETYFTTPASLGNSMTVNKISGETRTCISGTVLNLDFIYTQIITATVNDQFDSLGGRAWGIREGAVDVSPASDAAIKAQMDAAKARFTQGENEIGLTLEQLNAAYLEGVTEI